MKVLFTLDALYNGGTEKSLLDLATRFRRIEPVFCCFYEHRHLLEAFRAAGLRVHFLSMREAYGFRRAAAHLRAVLREERPELVVGHLLRAELVTRWVCARSGYPVVGTFVGDPFSPAARAVQSPTRRLKGLPFRVLDRLSARWCVHFIANSATAARGNADALGVPAERITVIRRGRDETVYSPAAASRAAPLRTMLNVARLREGKGHRELIRAFARVAPHHPEARLLIAGEGPCRPQLEREIRALGVEERVELLGNVEGIPQLLRTADLFVFPSHFEGFSGALVEAMLTGLPIVASDIPANLEAIADRSTALTFPVRDVAALAERLRGCLEHPDAAREMGARAREAAIARFTLDGVAAEYEALLLELAARYGPQGQEALAERNRRSPDRPGALSGEAAR